MRGLRGSRRQITTLGAPLTLHRGLLGLLELTLPLLIFSLAFVR